MSRVTPVAKRIKTIFLSGDGAIAANGEFNAENASLSWTWDEDVTLVGAELTNEISLAGISLVAPGAGWGLAQLSRSGVLNNPTGVLLQVNSKMYASVDATPDAYAFVLGDHAQILMFPEGYGMDFDEGTGIYVNTQTENNLIVGPMKTHLRLILYYVER